MKSRGAAVTGALLLLCSFLVLSAGVIVPAGLVLSIGAGAQTVYAAGSAASAAESAAVIRKKKTVKLTKSNKKYKMTVKAGTVITLKVKYGKKTLAASRVTFRSTKKKVASVSAAGLIKTKKKGTAKIKLKRKGKKQYATLTLMVLPPDPVEIVDGDDIDADTLADTAVSAAAAPAHYAAQTSAITGSHTHRWQDVGVDKYPAERCTICNIERWKGSEELKAEAEVTTSRRFIMIGDSYGARNAAWGGNYTWPYQLCKKMGLGENQAYLSLRGGYGFAAGGSASPRYYTDLLRLIDPDAGITDIIVVGGIANDMSRSKAEIEAGFLSFTMEARARFPKARIIYAAPNTHISNTTWVNTLTARRPWYKAFCVQLGWLYLDGCETILPREAAYFQADGHHPNAAGQEILGAGLMARLKGYL